MAMEEKKQSAALFLFFFFFRGKREQLSDAFRIVTSFSSKVRPKLFFLCLCRFREGGGRARCYKKEKEGAGSRDDSSAPRTETPDAFPVSV